MSLCFSLINGIPRSMNSLPSSRIKRFKAYQKPAQHQLLSFIGACHCLMELILQNGETYFIERNQMTFVIMEGNTDDSFRLLQQQNIKSQYSLKQVMQKANQIIPKPYDIVENNCYHFIAAIVQLFGFSKVKIILTDDLNKISIISKGSLNVLNIVDKVDDVIVVADKAKNASNALKVGARGASISSVTPLGLGITIVAETGIQLIEMARNNFEEQAVAKGVANIGVGVAGSVGGFVGGAQLGAAIGVVGGPIGIAVGGLIGGSIGSFAGSKLGKALMPWNW